MGSFSRLQQLTHTVKYFVEGGERRGNKKRVVGQEEAVVEWIIVVRWDHDRRDREVVCGEESGELLDGGSQALASTSGWIQVVRPRPWRARATGSKRGRGDEPGDDELGGEEIEVVPLPTPCAADVEHEDKRRMWWWGWRVRRWHEREKANGNAFWSGWCDRWRSWRLIKLISVVKWVKDFGF
jgi:hypothetical protein